MSVAPCFVVDWIFSNSSSSTLFLSSSEWTITNSNTTFLGIDSRSMYTLFFLSFLLEMHYLQTKKTIPNQKHLRKTYLNKNGENTREEWECCAKQVKKEVGVVKEWGCCYLFGKHTKSYKKLNGKSKYCFPRDLHNIGQNSWNHNLS